MSGQFALRNKAGMVPAGRNLMRRDIETMPEIFTDNGYATGLFGKWHLGDTYPYRPMDRGFQRVVWHKGWGLASEIEYDNSYYKTRYLDQMHIKYSNQFCANLWFDEAMEWMDIQIEKKQPFFTYLTLNTPHSPFDPLPEDLALYEDKVPETAARFFALINNIDHNYGRLEKWLQERGIRDNTVLVFMNDNGSSAGASIYNSGMKGKKGSEYEGGHRAICFIRWPDGGFGKPRTVDGNAHITDILPTFVDLFGFKTSRSAFFDGTSLKPVLRSESTSLKDRKLIVQYGGRIRPEKYQKSSVMMRDWRLVDGKELYNISDDPGQKEDVALKHPEIVASLNAHYEQYWNSIKDSIDEVEPIVIGHGKEPYTDLTSNNWIEVDCDNRMRVAAGGKRQGGNYAFGTWQIEASVSGTYTVQLSRWPFHMKRKLTALGPKESIGGDKLNPGVALPIVSGVLSIDGGQPISSDPTADGTMIELIVNLQRGLHKMEAWFEDSEGKKISGAFYGRIMKGHASLFQDSQLM